MKSMTLRKLTNANSFDALKSQLGKDEHIMAHAVKDRLTVVPLMIETEIEFKGFTKWYPQITFFAVNKNA